MADFEKRFLQFDKSRRHVPEEIIKKITSTGLCLRHFEKRVSGGPGEMYIETAEFTALENRYFGWVQCYVVEDNNTSGCGANMSVLFKLNEKTVGDVKQKVLEVLNGYEFVAFHSSFKPRPMNNYVFGTFMEEPYWPSDLAPFKRLKASK